jgi:hypothetical protein
MSEKKLGLGVNENGKQLLGKKIHNAEKKPPCGKKKKKCRKGSAENWIRLDYMNNSASLSFHPHKHKKKKSPCQ